MLYKDNGHTRIDYFIDVDWIGLKIDRKFTTSCYVFVGRNIVFC